MVKKIPALLIAILLIAGCQPVQSNTVSTEAPFPSITPVPSETLAPSQTPSPLPTLTANCNCSISTFTPTLQQVHLNRH